MAYNSRGLCKYYLKIYEEAINDFDIAINFVDNLTIAYNNRGLSKYHLERYEEAINDFNIVINLYENSNKNLKYYINLDNELYESYNNRGLIKYELGDYRGAIDDLMKVIEFNPNSSITYNNLGIIFRAKKDYASSNLYFDKSIEIDKNIFAYVNRGINYRILKEHNEAKKYYDIVLNNKEYINFSYKLFYCIYRLYSENGINETEYKKYTEQIIIDDLSRKDHYLDIKNNNYRLYNYTKINKNTIRTILNEELWLSHVNNFNDPIDPAIKILNEKNNNIFQYLIDLIAIGCISLTNDNFLMWSHYADKHEGICIEYDLYDFINNPISNVILKKVDYVEKIINDRNAILTDKYNNQYRLTDILSVKSKEWEYEKEYRIIKYCINMNNTIKLPIKKIYFGAKTSKEDKELLIKMFGFKGIRFFQISFDDIIINKLNSTLYI